MNSPVVFPTRPSNLPSDLEWEELRGYVRDVLGDLASTSDSPSPTQLADSLLWAYRDRRSELEDWTTLLVTWFWLEWWMEAVRPLDQKS